MTCEGKQNLNISSDLICLNKAFSTTRRVTKEKPVPESVLFLPEGQGRNGEGGLRTQGYFKKNLPDKPLISVITVVFNGENSLEETINSVITQTYDNVEYIIIDGRSTDGTLDIVEKYSDQIDYWVSERDKGVYDAMNKGISLATGNWLYFLGADDVLLKNAFYNLHPEMYKNDCVVYGDVYWPLRHKIHDGKFSKYKLMHSNICHQSIIYGSKVIKDKRFDINYPILSDHHLNIRLFSEHNFFYRPVLICIYNDCGLSQTDYDGNFYKDMPAIIKQYFGMPYYWILLVRRSLIKILSFMGLKSFIKKILARE